MVESLERLGGDSAVKATLLRAHLMWLEGEIPNSSQRLAAMVDEESRRFLNRRLLATEWLPFRNLVAIDQAIVELVEGDFEEVFHELGHHSAIINLEGVYKVFRSSDPHQYFQQMELLHRQFQNYGRSVYEPTGERSGTIRLEDCDVYSRVFCGSSLGFYEGSLVMMKVPGPVSGRESLCYCRGDSACQFDLTW